MKNTDQRLVNTVREMLAERTDVEERNIFRGVHFMVDDKMCVAVTGDEMMCRIGAENIPDAIEKNGCRQMTMGGKTVKDFVLIEEHVLKSKKDFDYWIGLCMAFNPLANASKKKKKQA